MQFRQLKKKLNNSHVLSLLTNGSVTALGMVTYALLCHTLSLKDRGIWLLFQSTYVLTESMRNGFLATGFIKSYAGVAEAQARQVAGSAWFVAAGITLIFCLVNIPAYFLAGLVEDEGVALFLKWFGLLSVLSLPFFMATCLVQAQERFDRLLKLRLIHMLSFISCIILAHFFFKDSVSGAIYAYAISLLVTSLFAVFSGWSQVRSILNKKKAYILDLYHFGKYTVGTAISSNLFRTIDNFVIDLMLGPAALAICDIAAKLLEIIELPMRSFAASGLPILSAAHNNNQAEKVIITMKKLIGILTIVMVPVVLGIIIFAEIPIALIGGGKYLHTDAVNLARLFILFALLTPADRFMALTLDAIHRPQVNFIKVLIMLLVTLIANYIGIYLAGSIFGFAYASVMPVITAIFISYFALQRYRPFGFWDIYVLGYRETVKNAYSFLQNFRKK